MISFIRSFLPAFQVELAQFARISKQNLTQFVKQHESLFLEINSSNALVDLDELLSTTSSHQLKRRYSPDFLIDSENLNLTPSGKRFHSMQHRSTASPTAKLATGAQSINQAIAAAQQANNLSTSKASMAGNSSVTSSAMNCAGLNSSSLANAGLTNPSILHSHLAQARQAMLEELMGNRYYQSPIQQQFNLINQQLNQQIVHGSNNPKLTKQQQQNSLMQHANGNHLNSGNLNSNLSSNLSSNLNSNQLNSGSGVGSQLTSGNQLNNQLAGQLSGHLQANLLVNNPLNLNKQQLERLALLERYEKELALQQQAKQQNDLRLEANAQANAQKLRTNGLPMNVLAPQQQQGQLMNGLNLSASSGSASQHPPTAGHHQRPVEQPMNEEEFKNIETMLNCIINMVEKTKKALSILQQKNHQQQENRHEQANSPNADWARAKMPLKTLPINKNLNNVASQPARSLPLKSSTPPIISLDGDYIDLRKSKDQLFSSLNIVSNPVTKMPLNRSNAQTGKCGIRSDLRRNFQCGFYSCVLVKPFESDSLDAFSNRPFPSDLMAIEKSKMESILNNMRRQVVQELQTNNVQEDSLEVGVKDCPLTFLKILIESPRYSTRSTAETNANFLLQACWNCGRKATDTCSGCNEAKYCGAFCQQKDWESHHENCGKNAAAANLAPENLSTVNESSESSSVNCQADDAEPTEENRLGLICKETVKGKENVKSNSTKESVPAADPANNLANDDTGKDEEKDESLATGDDDSAELKIVTETEEISSSSKRDTKEKASD